MAQVEWRLTRLDFPWFSGQCLEPMTHGGTTGRCGHTEIHGGMHATFEGIRAHYEKRHGEEEPTSSVQ